MRTAAVAMTMAAMSVVSCKGASSDSATPSSPREADGPPASVAAPGQAAPAIAPTESSDACSIVTTDEVAEAFGGTVAPGTVNGDDGSCVYEVSGTGRPAEVVVAVGSDYIDYAVALAEIPTVEEVGGVGRRAWYYPALHQLHVDIGGSELLVSTTVAGAEAALKAKVTGFAKTVLGKL